MSTHRKKSFFVSTLLFVVTVLASLNLFSCGDSGNNAPVIFGVAPNIGVETLISTGGGSGCIFASPGSVTINGANFGAKQGTSFVTFDNYNAGPATSWADNSIVVNAPANSTPQPTDPRVYPGANGYYNADVPVKVTVNYLTSNAVTYTYSVTCK